jgi:hypothetical protein
MLDHGIYGLPCSKSLAAQGLESWIAVHINDMWFPVVIQQNFHVKYDKPVVINRM